jgi:1A family penicillin-binding protein
MWHTPEGRLTLIKYASGAVFVGIVGLFLLTTIVFAVFSVGLPDPNKVIRRDGYSTIIYDRNGKTLYDVYNKENRIPLKLANMPKYLQEATIAIEDKDFYKHSGFSVAGIARSAFNILTLRGFGGGSTLTQQLVKNLLLSPEQTIVRKIKEVVLAGEIEKKFTKDDILQLYLNEAPYGGSVYGVESAARTYFGKSAKDLNLIESSILAGIPQLPSYYSPTIGSPKAYIPRATAVLRRMREDGYINPQQEADAVKQLGNVQFSTESAGLKAPHFVFYVKDQLVQKFGEAMVEGGGLRVTTTLDEQLQDQAEKIVKAEVDKIKPLKVSNGAAIVLNPKTGEILSMVGSYDFGDKNYGSYNVVTALRQPGSSGKPFVYAAALMKGYTAATELMDVKTSYPAGKDDSNKDKLYTPENYDVKYRGPMQLRFALGNSINTIAVKLTALVGLKDIMQTGFNAGISTWEPTQDNLNRVGLSLALGGQEVRLIELASAYGTFANAGVHVDPIAILKVEDANGKVLFENRQVAGKKVFSPEVSFLISHMLSDNVARKDVFGENNLLQVSGKTVAVKTGTTDLKRDNWTLGYTPERVIGVWVGNNDNTVMAPAITSGVTGAAPIWNKITKAALADLPNEQFPKPSGVDAIQIDALGGGLPVGDSPVRTEYFLKGTAPSGPAAIYKKLKISKSNGKLANDLEIKSGDYDEKSFVVFLEADPVSTDGKNRWQEAIDAWLSENKKDDSKFHPPTDKSDAKQNDVIINVDSPHEHDRINSDKVHVKAKAFASRDIVKFTVTIDGNEKINKANDSIDEDISGVSNGAHKIKFRAVDSGGNSSEFEWWIGVNANWDSAPATTSAILFTPFI